MKKNLTTQFTGAKTREELAHELNMSYSTLWRRMRETGIALPGRLLSPKEVVEIKTALGFVVEKPDEETKGEEPP